MARRLEVGKEIGVVRQQAFQLLRDDGDDRAVYVFGKAETVCVQGGNEQGAGTVDSEAAIVELDVGGA